MRFSRYLKRADQRSKDFSIGLVDVRSPAKHFHGREKERATWRALLRNAMAGEAGSTFIIQGPPGAGKTALMTEMYKEAASGEWNVVQIEPSMLHVPLGLADRMGLEYDTLVTKGVGGNAKVVSGSSTRQTDARRSVVKLLEVAGKEGQGLLLVLDEAQNLADLASNPTDAEVAKETLGAIHKATLGRPTGLLAAGLTPTGAIFDTLGVSRLHEDCKINLGRLSADAERAVIRDWLVEEGGAPESEVEPWVDAIAVHTDAWPHHIISFVNPASQVLQQTGGRLTDAGLERVLAEGKKRTAVYYDDRCEGLALEDVVLLGAVVSVGGRNGAWSPESLARAFRMRDRTDAQPAAAAVDEAIRKGVLSARAQGVYHIPNSSMANYLKSEFKAYTSRHPELAPLIEAAAKESLRSSWSPGLGRKQGDEPETPVLG